MAVEWNEKEIMDAVRAGANRGVVMATELILAEGNRLISSPPKTGRIYRRRGVVHQASAPGEPPATDTGRLVQSGRTEHNPTEISGTVNWSTLYAAFLEFGTSKMAPRPYARPALANKREEVIETVLREVQRELSK